MSERSEVSRGNTFDDGVGATRTRFDWSETNATLAVIETVARDLDRDPTDIAPLSEAVDPDALNSLVRSTVRNYDEISVSFLLEGRRVSLDHRGYVVVEDASDAI